MMLDGCGCGCDCGGWWEEGDAKVGLSARDLYADGGSRLTPAGMKKTRRVVQ